MYIGDYLPSATVMRGSGDGKANMKLLKLLRNESLTVFVTLFRKSGVGQPPCKVHERETLILSQG